MNPADHTRVRSRSSFARRAGALRRGLIAALLVGLPGWAPVGVAAEHAVWGLLSGPRDPPQMGGHAAVYDPIRHRMVIVDPADPQELWSLRLPASGPPSWDRTPVGGSSFPTPRTFSSAVYDAARDRVLVFGGRLGFLPSTNEVWSLSLGDEPRWTAIVPEGTPPEPRDESAAIYDPVRDRMIVYGGVWKADFSDEVLYGDVWSLELAGTPRWVPLSPPGTPPGKRKGASAVYDPSGDRMLVFGGWTKVPLPYPWSGYTHEPLDETWSLSLSGTPEWRLVAVTDAPPGRQETVAVVDATRGRLVVSGGSDRQWGGQMNDTWALPLDAGLSGTAATWTRLPTPDTSPSVSQHAAIYSPERDRLIQYGGSGVGNLCYELDLASATWHEIDSDVSGPFPSRRIQPTLMADPVLPRLRLFGGGRGCQHDLWEFPLEGAAGWTRLETSGIAPTCRDPNFVVDPAGRRLLCITGSAIRDTGTLDQVWALPFDEPRVWTQLQTHGTDPPPRFDYGLAYDTSRRRVLLFGGGTWENPGQNQADDRDDLWELSLDDLTWRQLSPSNSPGARRRPSVHYDPAGDRLIVVGGATSIYRGSLSRSDCWALDLGAGELRWAPLAPDLPMVSIYDSAPQEIALDPFRNRLVYWDGGRSAWTLALDRPDAWRPLDLLGEPPPARDYFGLTYDARGDQMIVFGGTDGSQRADLLALRFSREVPVVVRAVGADGGTLPRHGLVEADILGGTSFAVDSILAETVVLGGAHAVAPRSRGGLGERRDVNGDDFEDLVLLFRAESLRVAPPGSPLHLWGETPHFGIRGVAVLVKPPPARRRASRAGAPAAAGVLALAPVNPGSSTLTVRFSLAGAEPARLEVYDVAGRRIEARDLTDVGPGEHRLEIGGAALRPGLYLIRLRQGARQVVARGLLVR